MGAPPLAAEVGQGGDGGPSGTVSSNDAASSGALSSVPLAGPKIEDQGCTSPTVPVGTFRGCRVNSHGQPSFTILGGLVACFSCCVPGATIRANRVSHQARAWCGQGARHDYQDTRRVGDLRPCAGG